MTAFKKGDPNRRKTFRVPTKMADHYEIRLELNQLMEIQASQSMRVVKIMQKMTGNPQFVAPGVAQECSDLLVKMNGLSEDLKNLRARVFGDGTA